MRPLEVEQLITDLKAERRRSHVTTTNESKMVVNLEETEERHVFTSAECRLLLADTATVERLFEALNFPEEAFIELHEISVDPDVMAELEGYASTVDEM